MEINKIKRCSRFKRFKKKAQLGDAIYILGGLVGLAFAIFIAFTTYTQFNNEWQNMTEVNQESKDTVAKFSDYFKGMENAFIILIVGLTIALVISTFLIPSTPTLIFVNIIGLIVLSIMGAFYSYIFKTIILSDPMLISTGIQYPVISHIMNYFHYYCVGLVVILTIVAYGKYKLVDDYGY